MRAAGPDRVTLCACGLARPQLPCLSLQDIIDDNRDGHDVLSAVSVVGDDGCQMTRLALISYIQSGRLIMLQLVTRHTCLTCLLIIVIIAGGPCGKCSSVCSVCSVCIVLAGPLPS